MTIPTTKKHENFKDPIPDKYYLNSFGYSFLRNVYLFCWFLLTMYAIATLSPYVFNDNIPPELKINIAILIIIPVGVLVLLFNPIWREAIKEMESERRLK